MNESLWSRGMTIALSCLLHLGLATALILDQQWVTVTAAVRPPVLPVQLVTLEAQEEPRREPPPLPAPAPRQRTRPPRLLDRPQPLETPAAVKAEEPTPPPMPAAPLPTPTAPAAIPPAPPAIGPAPPTSESVPGSGPPAPAIIPSLAPGTPPAGPPVIAAARSSTAIPEGVTQYARPREGYQVRPSYPAAPRRLGIQGTTLLRVHVLADGRIGEVLVESSAGHPDLDQAAAGAVRAWRFEPAQRGSEPVAMWVLLPVEFRLR